MGDKVRVEMEKVSMSMIFPTQPSLTIEMNKIED